MVRTIIVSLTLLSAMASAQFKHRHRYNFRSITEHSGKVRQDWLTPDLCFEINAGNIGLEPSIPGAGEQLVYGNLGPYPLRSGVGVVSYAASNNSGPALAPHYVEINVARGSNNDEGNTGETGPSPDPEEAISYDDLGPYHLRSGVDGASSAASGGSRKSAAQQDVADKSTFGRNNYDGKNGTAGPSPDPEVAIPYNNEQGPYPLRSGVDGASSAASGGSSKAEALPQYEGV